MEKYDFYFSAEQNGSDDPVYAELDSGEIVQYSECVSIGKSPANFEDMEYLGQGVFHNGSV